jgi:HEPN domain-containing protein
MIREEALRWFEEGNNDLSTARLLLDNKKYNPSAFYSQQAAEKIMKGLLLAHNEIAWGHSVLSLVKRFAEIVDIDTQEIKGCARELDRHYIPSRYPDAYPSGGPSDYYTDKISKEALSCALKVKEFAERIMQR